MFQDIIDPYKAYKDLVLNLDILSWMFCLDIRIGPTIPHLDKFSDPYKYFVYIFIMQIVSRNCYSPIAIMAP